MKHYEKSKLYPTTDAYQNIIQSHKDDFVIEFDLLRNIYILATPFQLQWLINDGNICFVDGTFNIGVDNYILTIFLIKVQGLPVIRPLLLQQLIRYHNPVSSLCTLCNQSSVSWRCAECNGAVFCDKCVESHHSKVGSCHMRTRLSPYLHTPSDLFSSTCLKIKCSCSTEATYSSSKIIIVDILKCAEVEVMFHDCHIPKSVQLMSLGAVSSAVIHPTYAFTLLILELAKGLQFTSSISSHHLAQSFSYFHKQISYSSSNFYINPLKLKSHLHLALSQYLYPSNAHDNLNSFGIPLPFHQKCPSCSQHIIGVHLDACQSMHVESGKSTTVQVYKEGLSVDQELIDEYVATNPSLTSETVSKVLPIAYYHLQLYNSFCMYIIFLRILAHCYVCYVTLPMYGNYAYIIYIYIAAM